jgi:hypothetical protein
MSFVILVANGRNLIRFTITDNFPDKPHRKMLRVGNFEIRTEMAIVCFKKFIFQLFHQPYIYQVSGAKCTRPLLIGHNT